MSRYTYSENKKIGSLTTNLKSDDVELWLIRVDPDVSFAFFSSFRFHTDVEKLDISELNQKTIRLTEFDNLHEGSVVGKFKGAKHEFSLFQTSTLETESLVSLVPKDGEFVFGRESKFCHLFTKYPRKTIFQANFVCEGFHS